MKDGDELMLQINADEMCRTCLGQLPAAQLKPIFCNEILDGKIVPFPRVVETTFGIKPVKNDVFPNNVCVTCKTKLKELYSFKEKASKSLDLLYEIYGLDKPEPQVDAIQKKETSVSGTQTDRIEVNVVDEDLYSSYLVIEKEPKPTTIHVGTQMKPMTKEHSCQVIPTPKKTNDRSIQTEPDKPELRHSEVQVDMRDEMEVLVETEMEDENFSQLDVIEENDESEHITEELEHIGGEAEELQPRGFQESEIADIVEQEDINFDEKSNIEEVASSVKLEPLTEQQFPSDIEYLTYEVIEAPSEKESANLAAEDSLKISHKKTHECLYCQYVSDSEESFNRHYAIHEQSIENVFESLEYLRCTNCKYVFLTANALGKHMNAGPCEPHDPTYFIESSDTRKHEEFYNGGMEQLDVCLPKIKSFYKDNDSLIICGKCSLPFESLSDALQHYSSFHPTEDDLDEDVNQIWEESEFNQIHVCGICLDAFKDARYIRQHLYFHRSKFECPYGCSQFSTKEFFKLTDHINRKHLTASPLSLPGTSSPTRIENPQNLNCNICSKKFASKASYKVHIRNHNADRRFSCTFCPKAFIQKSDLTIHIRSHTDERPFACPIEGCDKRFRTSSHRRDHMSTHAEERKYQCDVCQKYFKAERILQGHMRLHSGFKPYECTQCGKSFSRKHHVKLHMKTHEKSVSFKK